MRRLKDKIRCLFGKHNYEVQLRAIRNMYIPYYYKCIVCGKRIDKGGT